MRSAVRTSGGAASQISTGAWSMMAERSKALKVMRNGSSTGCPTDKPNTLELLRLPEFLFHRTRGRDVRAHDEEPVYCLRPAAIALQRRNGNPTSRWLPAAYDD